VPRSGLDEALGDGVERRRRRGEARDARRVPERRLREEITMNTEEKKSLIRRCYKEVWSEGNLGFVDEHMTNDYVNIDPATPGTRLQGR
jgi:hypothetical protein